MDKYTEYVTLFESRGCKLLTSYEDFIEMNKDKAKSCLVNMKLIASCGHEKNMNVKNFNQNKKDIVCNLCIKNRNGILQKETQLNISNSYLSREIDFTREFQEFIKNDFESKLTKEGCPSDLIIKPNNIIEDNWLRIQIKLTQDKYRNYYVFCLNTKDNKEKYINNVMIFNCIKEDIYWIMEYEEISQCGEKILLRSTERSKYSKFVIEKKDIVVCLKDYYKKTELYTENDCMIPTNEYHKKEHIYRKKIYDNLSFLTIKEPEYTNMVYDLLINNKKVQEKIAQKRRNFSYNCKLTKTGENKKKISYIKGDNDFYWIHVPESDLFYVIPQVELLKRDLISFEKSNDCKSFLFNIKNEDAKHSWVSEFMFNYKNVNKEYFENLINTDYSKEENDLENEYKLSKQFTASCSTIV